jgi:hypothetical protein
MQGLLHLCTSFAADAQVSAKLCYKMAQAMHEFQIAAAQSGVSTKSKGQDMGFKH